MTLIGLTGGIGMGKSTVANLLQGRGLPIVDTDALAREVVEPGKPALEEIQRVFGKSVLGPDGQLRRDELARLVFSDETRRKQLEAIMHPEIRKRWLAQVEAWRGEGRSCGVVVIPLLFETGAEAYFNTILCVACSTATQHQRLLGRGWSIQQIQQRLDAQRPIDKKIALAHYVLWSEGGLDLLDPQIEAILRKLPSNKTP